MQSIESKNRFSRTLSDCDCNTNNNATHRQSTKSYENLSHLLLMIVSEGEPRGTGEGGEGAERAPDGERERRRATRERLENEVRATETKALREMITINTSESKILIRKGETFGYERTALSLSTRSKLRRIIMNKKHYNSNDCNLLSISL